MCDYGDTVSVRVRVPAHLSHTGQGRDKDASVDRCVAPIVEALYPMTIASCCGHGDRPGEVHLDDGRVLTIQT